MSFGSLLLSLRVGDVDLSLRDFEEREEKGGGRLCPEFLLEAQINF